MKDAFLASFFFPPASKLASVDATFEADASAADGRSFDINGGKKKKEIGLSSDFANDGHSDLSLGGHSPH